MKTQCLHPKLGELIDAGWRLGLDTHEIAKRLFLSEAIVYNHLAERRAS